jgi:hypothetical protein
MPLTRQAVVSQPTESEANMGDVVRNELKNFFSSNEFKDMLSNAVNILVDNAVKQASTAPMLERIKTLESELAMAAVHINENEQYSRKYNLRFVGLDESEGEDCVDKVVDFCKEKLDINVDKAEVDRAHRLGPKNSFRPRTVIIKFKSYGPKASIYKQRKSLKGTKYYINEDITKFNMKLVNSARDHKVNIKSAWFSDGKVLVRNTDGDIMRIRQMSDFFKYSLIDVHEGSNDNAD